ncbi:MAG: hypothetical protein P8L28_06610 [Flavobacteriaceae bacterium]|nr:hypothetical protein [Flavobacteriaceae bacterium]|tara:strand:+ start:298 stop:1230 length:933 start_codon:yes stop_codon:yes gene_type:complete
MIIKKNFFKLFFFLYFSTLSAQEVVIVNSTTKEEIPYVAIQYTKNIGVYTNNRGRFHLLKSKSEHIKIYHIGYNDTIIKCSLVRDTIFFKKKIEILDEIKIFSGKSKEKLIGYNKKRVSLFWSLKEKTELVTLIKYKKNKRRTIIKKILIPINKRHLRSNKGKVIESYPNFSSIFRFNIYSNEEGKPGIKLLNKPLIIECNQNSPNILEIDISKDIINLPKEGVFVGIEMIGMLDVKGEILLSEKNEMILPTFKFTDKKKNNISSTTYIKTTFNGNKWKNTKEYNGKVKHLSNYNMALSLLIKIYKNKVR